MLVTTDLPSWDLQLRSDPPSYALGATTNYKIPTLTPTYADGLSTVVFILCVQHLRFGTVSFHDAVSVLYLRSEGR